MTDLPKNMRALVRGRGPEWELGRVPVPAPGSTQILVRNIAVSTNNADIHELAEADPGKGGRGDVSISGYEFAGEVAALGEQAGVWQVGDLVMGSTVHAFAEYAVVEQKYVIRVPQGMPAEEACALPSGLLTEHGSLRRAGFTAGQSVLVTGASTGMGLLGVQVAKALGASPVIATTRSESKREMLTSLGADQVIIGDGAAITGPVLEGTKGEGADVVLDHVAGQTFAACLPATKVGGFVVNIGRLAGATATIDLDALSWRHLNVRGVSFGFNDIDGIDEALADLATDVIPAVVRGEIRPVIDSTVSLNDYLQVAARLRSGELRGKIVMTLD